MKQRKTMKPLSLCSPLIIIHSYTTLFFLLATTVFSSVDPKYQACEPKTCEKGPNISYPLYIKGKQEPFCGYPRFGLTCGENGFPILKRGNNSQFIVHDIFYNSQSLRVSIPAFTDCVAPMRNRTSSGRRFSVAPNQKEVLLFYGCDLTSLPKRMQENAIGCSGNRTRSVVALYREDTNLSIAAKNCEGKVVNTTVEGEVEKGGIKEALQRGFLLNWTASYCGDCRNSGGRCGFDLDKRIYAFRCYCPDRVHATRCDVPSPIQSESNTTACIAPTQNTTIGKYRFRFGPNQRDLLLFYGCDLTSVGEDKQEHRIGCSAENRTSSVAAFYREDQNLSLVRENCKGSRLVNAVVEDGKGGIQEALKKGFILNWNASNCSECTNSGGRCGFDLDTDTYAFRCYCPDRVHAVKCGSKAKLSKTGKLSIGLGVGLTTILIIGLLLLLYKIKHSSSGSGFQTRNTNPSNPEVENAMAYFKVPVFSYKELEEATNHFDHYRQIGDGGFGTVYYGKLRDGREVAVKHMYEHNYRRVEQFLNEVKILTRLRHKNLVQLYGCTSRDSRDLLLVYEYIPNGTVACHLHGELAKPGLLPWSIRLKIAIETASALAYLHASDIIHRDVKTNNILLDNGFCVKVADFGLSRLFPSDVTHVSTAPQGTPGYVDPEYYQCYQLTSKSDVYSFGVVLIELISSKPAVDINRHKDEINLSNLAIKKIQESALNELVDPSLGFDSDNEVQRMIVLVAELAFQCLQRDKELRPSMDEAFEVLRRIENGKDDEPRRLELEEAPGVSRSNVKPSLPISPEWDDVGLLKNKKPPNSSPISVTDNWESKSTTPNVSS